MKEDGKFCRAFLRTMDPEQAAEAAKRKDGFSLLVQNTIQARLEEMRGNVAGQIRREDVIRKLAQLAFGSAADAIRLALAPGQVEPEKMDLSAVAEFKVTDKGVEMKLVDRVRALESLYNLLESSDEGGADELYRALEDAADQMEGRWNDG